jgi:muramoyltetrapeptide carboxypeptidase
MRIGIVAPSTPIGADVADAVDQLAAARFPEVSLAWHPQCFRSHGHFAGTDTERADAFLQVANDPSVDVLWFARGGYGSCRIAEEVLRRLEPPARNKTYLGYSDAGFMLAGLRRAGFPRLVHGPMPADVRREGGEGAILACWTGSPAAPSTRWSRTFRAPVRGSRSTSPCSASCSAHRWSRSLPAMC